MKEYLSNIEVIDAAIAVVTCVATVAGLAWRGFIKNRAIREGLAIVGGHGVMAVKVAMAEWRAGMVEARADGVVTPEEEAAVGKRALEAFWDAVSLKKVIGLIGGDKAAAKRWGDNLVAAEVSEAMRGAVAPQPHPPQGR
jgi:hypothetical protein